MSEASADARLRAAAARVAAHETRLRWVDDESYRVLNAGPFELLAETRQTYAAVVRALLKDGPLQGKTVEVEAVEGRPPKTIDATDEQGAVYRYCLEDWTQEGMTAAYTFLYTV